jgi:hypothetical protein
MNNETVTDNTSSVEEVAVETIDETPSLDEDLTIDALMGLTEEDASEFIEDARYTGMKPLHQWINNVPEDVRKHLANIRADYTRKTQEISAMRKQLEAEQATMQSMRSQTLNNPLFDKMQHFAQDQTEYDLYDADGMKAEIQRQAAIMLEQMMKPAREQIIVDQRRLELDRFKQENPDLTSPELKLSIAKLLQARPELKLEDAYYIEKAKLSAKQLADERTKLEAEKSSRRDTLRKTSTGSTTRPNGTPKFRDAWESYQWHKANGVK